MPEGRERAGDLRRELKRRKIDVHLVSGATGEGIEELLDAVVRALDSAPLPTPLERDVAPGLGAPSDASEPRLEDERERDRREREERAPPLTGREKDGMPKAKAAASQGKKPRSKRT